MKSLVLLTLFFTSQAFASSPTCTGIVATPAQREAYTQTMIRSWPKDQQIQFVKSHEKYILEKEPGSLDRWNRLYDEERMAILQYTSGLFGDLNRSLRSDDFNMWPAFNTLCSGLNKLPNYEGWVYRILDLTAYDFDQIKYKKTYTDRAFMSSATKMVLVWRKNTLLKIYTRHGKDLMGLGSHPEEKEVLLLPGSKFKVVKAKENPASSKYRYEITLKEVNSLDN